MWTFPAAVLSPPFADLARLPSDLAWGRAWQQARMQRGVLQSLQRPDANSLDGLVRSLWDSLGHALALPFDLLRLQHAAGVLAGAWPRSLLESTRFEQQLGAMERLALGPLARGDRGAA
jgi:hypothetical protein